MPAVAQEEQVEASPEEVFEEFWAIYNDGYALFGVKNIDWDAVYDIYRPKVTAETSDEDLFAIISEIAGLMHDLHVVIRDEKGGRFYRSGSRSLATGDFDIGTFSLDLIGQSYATDGLKSIADGTFHYGMLSGNVGYLHFRSFNDMETSVGAIDEIISAFEGAGAVIIDVRQNGGGSDAVGQTIANRFADQKRLYMSVQMRNIMEPRDSFAEPVDWYLEPAGPAQFTGPVVLLTNSRSISAAENFALAMRALPHAAIVGEYTAGVFADAGQVPLPNGWTVDVSVNIFRDPDGFNWEGIGVPPDYWMANKADDIETGQDRVLGFALDLIDTGRIGRQDGSQQPPRHVPVE
uniref:Peptidase S41 n=1 Tax=Aquisalinus luteolus TaxID=1566827 RepID=A0A8J3A4L2_9PROT|nr:peptidase S41 [Aquisalinus luteolus]